MVLSWLPVCGIFPLWALCNTVLLHHLPCGYIAARRFCLRCWRHGLAVPNLFHRIYGYLDVRSCLCHRLLHRHLPLDGLFGLAVRQFIEDTAFELEFIQRAM